MPFSHGPLYEDSVQPEDGCTRTQRLLPDYVGNQVMEQVDIDFVAAHLQVCNECRIYYNEVASSGSVPVSCQTVQALLPDYREGHLLEVQRRDIADHLASCEHCSAAYAAGQRKPKRKLW